MHTVLAHANCVSIELLRRHSMLTLHNYKYAHKRKLKTSTITVEFVHHILHKFLSVLVHFTISKTLSHSFLSMPYFTSG